MLVITDDPLQCLMLILPCVVCAGIILREVSGRSSFLPGERPELVCDHSNLSDPENVVFFRNGIELQSDADYFIPTCPSPCQTTVLVFIRFADRLSGNYTCNVTSGSQVIASNTLPVSSARKLFSGLPSSPFNIESILTV